MSETKLYRINGHVTEEIPAQAVALEKSLQTLMEQNLQSILGIRFLASEYSTGATHGGRIDTLGLDENYAPVIIEYKRAVNENVINQGLFYLDWLLDHRGDFKILVMSKLGTEEANKIDWTGPRLICVASDFNRYDGHAVKQINRNIELMRYRKYGADLIALELIHTNSVNPSNDGSEQTGSKRTAGGNAESTPPEVDPTLQDLLEALRAYLLALGDDVQEKQLKLYTAFRRIKNFACVVPQRRWITLYLRLDPSTIELDTSFMRDVSNVGHWATGDTEVTLKTMAQFERIQPLLRRAYEGA